MELNVKSWKTFILHEIFDIEYGSKLDIGKMTHNNPKIAFVSRTGANNGVIDYVDKIEGINIYKAGSLTLALGGTIGTCCVQLEDFYTSQNVAVIIPKYELSTETKLFVANIISNECRTRYRAFGRELNSHIKTDLSIKLPQTANHEPDWNFMNDYMKSLSNETTKRKTHIIKVSDGDEKIIKTLINKVDAHDFNTWADPNIKKSIPLDTIKWKPFVIGKLFETYTGGDLIIGKIQNGNIPVVTHSAESNSVKTYSAIIPGKKLFNHKTTISLADRGTFFATIQNEDFYIGTRVKALEAKFQCNSLILMFISVIINNERFRFNYGRNCTDNLENLVISLPIEYDKNQIPKIDYELTYSDDGFIPDWSFMEKYIRALPYSKHI